MCVGAHCGHDACARGGAVGGRQAAGRGLQVLPWVSLWVTGVHLLQQGAWGGGRSPQRLEGLPPTQHHCATHPLIHRPPTCLPIVAPLLMSLEERRMPKVEGWASSPVPVPMVPAHVVVVGGGMMSALVTNRFINQETN